MTYTEKIYGLRGKIEEVRDGRKRSRIKTKVALGSGLVMMLSRMGSLNAQEATKGNLFWKKWIGSELPSADTMGRVFAGINTEDLRKINRHVYSLQKRNKALDGNMEGLRYLIVDCHEQHTSYLCRCDGCCEREIGEGKRAQTQYYHRSVTAMLVCGERLFLLDSEMVRKGEDEVGCAMRLLERVMKGYVRAFDVIIGDGLYAQGRFFKFALEHGKDVMAVLKDDRRDLMKDALGIFETIKPEEEITKNLHRQMWDAEGFTSWEGFGKEVRVVRSLETKTIRRQMSKKEEKTTSDWIWVTTLPKRKANTRTIVKMGHRRWAIENEGFNELVNSWHADHIYKHNSNAIAAFWLIMSIAYNLFNAFIELNLKPAIRKGRSREYWASVIAGELYAMEFAAGSAYSGP